MAASSYGVALAQLLAHEGGYTNDPADPGGPTNFGITIGDYRKYVKPGATAADVRTMAVEEAKAIYHSKYWDAQRCDDLPAGVDYAVFDYGVNSGISRSGKVLHRVLGLADNDWRTNDDVLATLARRDAGEVIAAVCDERLRFLRSLKTWNVFGKGWDRRVAEVKARALELAAGEAAKEPAADLPCASKGVVPLARGSQKASAGVVIAAGAAAARQANQSGARPAIIVVIIIATLVAAAAAYAFWRRRQAIQQSRLA